jgi:Flp pilus assembly protein TadG
MNVRYDDRGAVSVVLMLLVLITLAGASLVVDGGRAMSARRHASNIAEAAARAAVSTATPVETFDPTTARRAAISYAARAGVPASDVVVEVHADFVRVTVTERRVAVFLALSGRTTMTVRASGVGRVVYSG